jgi:hypothetical protein
MKTHRNYFIHFQWAVPHFEHKSDMSEKRFWATGPIDAINQFHREMQRKAERDVQDRNKILRPKLRPNEYKIIKLFLRYEDGRPLVIENTFDLPATGNPDLGRVRVKKQLTESFDFMAEVSAQES